MKITSATTASIKFSLCQQICTNLSRLHVAPNLSCKNLQTDLTNELQMTYKQTDLQMLSSNELH